MPVNGRTCLSVKAIYEFRDALHKHFTNRGIPKNRHHELEFRWIKQKGYRLPQT